MFSPGFQPGPTQMARGLLEVHVDALYCGCSENKGADQLHGYSAADLGLYFHINKQVFSLCG